MLIEFLKLTPVALNGIRSTLYRPGQQADFDDAELVASLVHDKHAKLVETKMSEGAPENKAACDPAEVVFRDADMIRFHSADTSDAPSPLETSGEFERKVPRRRGRPRKTQT